MIDEGEVREAITPTEVLPVEADTDTITVERARELTDTIKSVAQGVYVLVAKAHEMRVDKILGYSTWAEYCETEFDMSASRSYQLINLSETVKAIESAAPEGTEIKLTEAQARDIKRELPSITQKITEETKELDPEKASERVGEIIEAARQQKKDDDAALKKSQAAFEQAQDDARSADLERQADGFLKKHDDGWDDPDSYEWSPSSPTMAPQDQMNVFNFFNALMGISGLPEPEEFIKVIPTERRGEVNKTIDDVAKWFAAFYDLWKDEA